MSVEILGKPFRGFQIVQAILLEIPPNVPHMSGFEALRDAMKPACSLPPHSREGDARGLCGPLQLGPADVQELPPDKMSPVRALQDLDPEVVTYSGSNHRFLFYVGGNVSTPALDLRLWTEEGVFALRLRGEVQRLRPYPVEELAGLYRQAAGYCRRYNCTKAQKSFR